MVLVCVSMSIDNWLVSLSMSSYPKFRDVCVWDSVVIDVWDDDILLDLIPILLLIGRPEIFSASVGLTSMFIIGSSSSEPNNSRNKNKQF